jgi:hypothetical protein
MRLVIRSKGLTVLLGYGTDGVGKQPTMASALTRQEHAGLVEGSHKLIGTP